MAQTFGLALIPWSHFGGILTGKRRRGQPIPADSRDANPNPVQGIGGLAFLQLAGRL